MAGTGTPYSSHRPGWLTDYVAHPRHGPLPALLIGLTIATGMVDAISILSLGRVFVANMTGNIVFIGFALTGAPGFSLQASLVALAAFLIGAAIGGAAVNRYGDRRGVLLRNALAVELPLLIAGAVVLFISPGSSTAARDLTVAFAGAALGIQNAAVRKLAVPDLTTTVLTMTLTGIAADVRKRDFAVAMRRIIAVGAMLIGAVAGALLVRYATPADGLTLACAVVAAVFACAVMSARGESAWQHPT